MQDIREQVGKMKAVGHWHKSNAPFFQFFRLLELPLLSEDVVIVKVVILAIRSFLPLEEPLKSRQLLGNLMFHGHLHIPK